MKVLKTAAKYVKITAIHSVNCASRAGLNQTKEPSELQRYKRDNKRA